MEMLSFDTDQSFSQNYKFLIGSILPRPIAVVGTINTDGSNNLAPFSFFTAVSADPMIIAICPFIRTSDLSQKDTTLNILREKEFTISIVTESIMEQVNQCSSELPYGEDEFNYSKLTPIASELIKAKRVKESPVHFECKLRDHIRYGEQAGSGQLITGEVIKVHVSKESYDEGRLITNILKPIGRGSGNDWFRCDNPVELERKMTAQIQK